LVARTDSLRSLGAKFSLTQSALRRHKLTHIPAVLQKAQDTALALHAGTLADHVRELYRRSGAILRAAETSGDVRNALGAVRELRSIIELIARMAEKDSTRVDTRVVRALLAAMFDVIHEFVAEDLVPSAIDRLQALSRDYADDETTSTRVRKLEGAQEHRP